MRGARARRLTVGVFGAVVVITIALVPLGPVAWAAPALTTVVGSRGPGAGGVGLPSAKGQLDQPSGIAFDAAGLFIADTDNCRVVEVPTGNGTLFGLAMKSSHFYTVAGGRCGAGRGSVGFPTDVALSEGGNLYIADTTGDRVLELPVAGTNRVLSRAARAARLQTVAGTGSPGSSGEGGPASSAELDGPTGVAVDVAGDLFIAETEGCRLDEVPANAGTQYGVDMEAGHLYTIAGTGTCGTAGNGGPAGLAELWNPTAVAVDRAGDVFVADRGAGTIVEVAATSGTYYGTPIGAGDLAVVAGLGVSTPYLADGFSATGYAAEVNDPEGLAVAPDGDLYMADTSERVIRVIPAANGNVFGRSMSGGDLYTVIGALPTGTGSDSTRWVTGKVTNPYGLALNGAGVLYFSDQGANKVVLLGPQRLAHPGIGASQQH